MSRGHSLSSPMMGRVPSHVVVPFQTDSGIFGGGGPLPLKLISDRPFRSETLFFPSNPTSSPPFAAGKPPSVCAPPYLLADLLGAHTPPVPLIARSEDQGPPDDPSPAARSAEFRITTFGAHSRSFPLVSPGFCFPGFRLLIVLVSNPPQLSLRASSCLPDLPYKCPTPCERYPSLTSLDVLAGD